MSDQDEWNKCEICGSRVFPGNRLCSDCKLGTRTVSVPSTKIVADPFAPHVTNPDAPVSGMTIREHMAVEFMKGLLSDPNIRDSSVEISAAALKCVDALLVALNKRGET